ncbi:TIGR02391 family protein [Micromonospora sp. NPDC002296]|uniref:TIGR02391 family protein n=1 Tax=Micromonospora sp. NPDC002296 TaxID=3154271 RepID=UPI00332A845D
MAEGKYGRLSVAVQVLYDQFRERGAWPTFTQVDRVLDRQYGIEDAQAELAALPGEYLPRSWSRAIFSDTDEIRLTLRGVAACTNSQDDLHLLVSLLRWAAEREQGDESDGQVVVSSVEFAEHVGLPLDADARDDEGSGSPEVADVRARMIRLYVLAQALPTFWNSAGQASQQRWRWTLTLSRGVRQFRSLADVDELLERDREFWQKVHEARTPAPESSMDLPAHTVGNDGQEDATPLDILVTILRPEIIDASAKQLRSGHFDDAIFAAFRRIEHEVQQRTGLNSIGDRLIAEAFGKSPGKPRISISDRQRDADRLVEIFGGAVGLHKGDRSHKDKPALPCRSRNECLRLLAHASALLDLLDRGAELAPTVVGYQQKGDLLELSVQRLGPEVQVWLDDQPCRVRARTPATLTIDVDGISTGPHDLYLVTGTRQGPAVPVFVSHELGSDNWHRVDEVGIGLFRDESGARHSDIYGVRLHSFEKGLHLHRIFPTDELYRVGDYIRWPSGGRFIGAVWAYQEGSTQLTKIHDGATLFNGAVIGPGQPERTYRLSLEPPVVRLRRDEKAPLRALRHVTDGVASWTEPLDSLGIVSDDERVAHYKGGVVTAKYDGITTLRLHHDGLYCAASIQVGAHLSGAIAEVLTGLPPVAGIACIGDKLVVSTRQGTLWVVEHGKYEILTSVPLLPPVYGGTDTIAAAPNGDLSIRMLDRRGILLMRAGERYRRSRLIELPEAHLISSMCWMGTTLFVGTQTGEVWQVAADSKQTKLAEVGGFVVALAADDERVYVAAGTPRRLLSFPLDAPEQVEDVSPSPASLDITDIIMSDQTLFLTDFHKGRVLALRDSQTREVATGLDNPGSLACSNDGTVYVAEFGRGAVTRILP